MHNQHLVLEVGRMLEPWSMERSAMKSNPGRQSDKRHKSAKKKDIPLPP